MAMTNCKCCGKLFQPKGERICPACIEAEEAELDGVLEFIRDNGAMTAPELAEATGVERSKINQWVRDGKLELKSASEGPERGCRKCGKPVGRRELCSHCRQTLAAEIAAQREGMQPRSAAAGAAAVSRERMHSRT